MKGRTEKFLQISAVSARTVVRRKSHAKRIHLRVDNAEDTAPGITLKKACEKKPKLRNE